MWGPKDLPIGNYLELMFSHYAAKAWEGFQCLWFCRRDIKSPLGKQMNGLM